MRALLDPLLFVTVISVTAIWFYWVALFPCLALHFRFQIQRFADDAYVARREGRISTISFLTLEYFFNLAGKVANHFEMIGLVTKTSPDRVESEEIEKRFNEAGQNPEIREAFFGVTRSMLAIFLVSHPVEFLKFSFLVIGAYFSDWAVTQRDREKKEVYVRASDLPDDGVRAGHGARRSVASC
jgi:hypothetical protein